MKYYAAIDTNVLVSAMLKWNSISCNVMELIFEVALFWYKCSILEEYYEVLSRPKFHLTEDFIDTFVKNIENRGLNVEAGSLDIVLSESKDKVFYEVVFKKRRCLFSNLKHFPDETFVVTPREMLNIVFSET